MKNDKTLKERTEVKVIEDGSKEEMLYNGIDLLDKLAYKLVSTENNNAVTIESLQQDNDLLLLFVKTYRLIAPSIKDVIEDVMEFDL
jgi:hypothetical protein